MGWVSLVQSIGYNLYVVVGSSWGDISEKVFLCIHNELPSCTFRQGSGEASAGTSRASTATSASEHRDVGHTKNGTGGGTAPSGVASPSITRRTTPKKRRASWNYI